MHCIEKGRNVKYLVFLQTVGKDMINKRVQEMVMNELANAGDEVLLFYNDSAFPNLVHLMKNERGDTVGDLAYHINLAQLLTMCMEGKNVATEIRCHSLLPLDEIVKVVTNWDCVFEVKKTYMEFLYHCYIDAEVDNKETFTKEHVWDLFNRSFLIDIAKVCNTHGRGDDPTLQSYVAETIPMVIHDFFNSQLGISLIKVPNVMASLSKQWADMIQVEQSILVNIFSPEVVFSPITKAYREAQSRFVKRDSPFGRSYWSDTLQLTSYRRRAWPNRSRLRGGSAKSAGRPPS